MIYFGSGNNSVPRQHRTFTNYTITCTLNIFYYQVTDNLDQDPNEERTNLKSFCLREHGLVPDHLHTLLCVHGQVGMVYPRHVPVAHLYIQGKCVNLEHFRALLCVHGQVGMVYPRHVPSR